MLCIVKNARQTQTTVFLPPPRSVREALCRSVHAVATMAGVTSNPTTNSANMRIKQPSLAETGSSRIPTSAVQRDVNVYPASNSDPGSTNKVSNRHPTVGCRRSLNVDKSLLGSSYFYNVKVWLQGRSRRRTTLCSDMARSNVMNLQGHHQVALNHMASVVDDA